MSDFSKQDTAELRKLVADKRETLRVFRFGGAGSRTRNVREGRNVRREIAQILTELRARELSAEKQKIASPAKKA
jgi:ribosomal protein L29